MAFWMPSVVKFSEWEDVSDMDVSVIIPTYKPQEYIWQCLDTLYQQTLEHRRYELIVVVNGCKEPYYSQILAHVAKWDKDLKVTVLQTDVPGVSHARNMGIERAEGKYVCFVDDDDWVSATYLEGLLSVAKGDETMVIGKVMNFDEGKNVFVDDWLTASYRRNSQLPDQASLMSCRSFMSVACCKLTARKAIGDYRFDTSFKQGEDSLFNATMSHRLRDFGVAPPDVIYYRRLRQSSASRTRSYADVFKDNFRLAVAFAKIYCKGMDKYDFLFFATRILACMKATLRSMRG